MVVCVLQGFDSCELALNVLPFALFISFQITLISVVSPNQNPRALCAKV